MMKLVKDVEDVLTITIIINGLGDLIDSMMVLLWRTSPLPTT